MKKVEGRKGTEKSQQEELERDRKTKRTKWSRDKSRGKQGWRGENARFGENGSNEQKHCENHLVTAVRRHTCKYKSE